jgi:hypothetical protein
MSNKLPAPTGKRSHPIAKAADSKQTQFINILKTDHNFDLVKKIVDHMGMIERAKKIKPQEKHRLLQNYYLTLLSYCLPKMKVVEDNSDKNKNPMKFTINIGGTAEKPKAPKKAGGVSITIPTNKNKDGSYSVSNSDPTD